LDHIVSASDLIVDLENIKVVYLIKWPIPKSCVDVKSFFGLCICNRRSMNDFVNNMTVKEHLLEWTSEC
jgi:hypothetical protein